MIHSEKPSLLLHQDPATSVVYTIRASGENHVNTLFGFVRNLEVSFGFVRNLEVPCGSVTLCNGPGGETVGLQFLKFP